MAMSPEDRRRATLAGLMVVIVAAFAFMMPGMGIKDTRKQITVQTDKKLDLESEVREMERKIDTKETLNRRLIRRRAEIEDQEARLPNSANLDDLFRNLRQVGDRYGVNFIRLEGLEPRLNEEEGYEEFPIAVQMVVDYHGLGHFLNDIETGERFVKVDNLMIDNGEDRTLTEGTRDWSTQRVTMELSTFRFIERKQPTPTPTPRS